MGAANQTPTRFGSFLAFMRGLHAHVFILGLPDFPVELHQSGVSGRVPDGVGELGRLSLVRFLKFQARRDLAGGRVNGALPCKNGLFRDFGLCAVSFYRRFLLSADRFF